MRTSLLPAFALLAACPGPDPIVYNTDPEVTITAPADGAEFPEGVDVVFEGRVTDIEDDAEALAIAWTHAGGVDLGSDVQVDGDVVTLYVPGGLELGDHLITLTAEDSQGARTSDDVSVSIVENAVPTASFWAPGGGLHVSELPIEIDARFTDPDQADLADLSLTWEGAAAGASSAPTNPDSTGQALFSLIDVPAGPQSITVTVADTLGASSQDTVTFEVVSADRDDDGYLDPAFGGDDCDDDEAAIHPGATEICNGIDDDCDGTPDDGATDPQAYYHDGDGDGYGDPGDSTVACTPPADFITDNTDCDDGDITIYPGAPELCDSLDNDCNGSADDGALPTWFRDADNDSYGDASNSLAACDPPTGYVIDNTDCDDTDTDVFPGAPELCNEVDDDCDGTLLWRERHDGDSDDWVFCMDCDDDDATISPDGTEVCNGLDDNCSGSPDSGDVCPCPVRVYDDRPYQFCKDVLKDWPESVASCAANGYHLASLADQAEDDWVNTTLDTFTIGYWWIGYNDIDTPDTWVWEDGSPVTHENWHTDEPNNQLLNEACVELNRFDPGNGWNDQPCDFTRKYICEFGT